MHTYKGILVHSVLSLNLAVNLAQSLSLFRKLCKLVPCLTDPQLDIAPRGGVD